MISADYIVGLTDGEGCFYVNIRDRNPRWVPKIQNHFYIKLREDNKELLEEVKESFGCGAVYIQKETRPNHSTCYRFEINSHRDILGVVIPFFEKHPLHGTKRNDFQIFREVAFAVKRGEHKSKEGFEEIRRMKLQMQKNRSPLDAGNPPVQWEREVASKLSQSARQTMKVANT
jgi:LAGLIDADG DNA endonuclease family protein